MTYYIIISVGCLECGNPSAVIGIFTNKEIATKTAKKHGYEGNDYIQGSGMVQLHQIDELDKDYDNNETMVED